MILTGETAEAKIRSLLDNLNKDSYAYQLFNRYRGGHTILTSNKTNKPNIYCIYKREFYKTFGYTYEEFKGELGDSINLEALERAINLNCEIILLIYPDSTYIAFPLLIKNFCEKKGLIRGQKRLNAYMNKDNTRTFRQESEITYSFPVSLLKEIYSVEEIY
jgi:hypothetical protein